MLITKMIYQSKLLMDDQYNCLTQSYTTFKFAPLYSKDVCISIRSFYAKHMYLM